MIEKKKGFGDLFVWGFLMYFGAGFTRKDRSRGLFTWGNQVCYEQDGH